MAQIEITSMMSLVDHTYEGEWQPAGAIYNADTRELDNLVHHLRFAIHASGGTREGGARDASPTRGVTPPAAPRPVKR